MGHRFVLCGFILWVASCGALDDRAVGRIDQAEPILDFERPEDLVRNASRRLADHLTLADVGHTYGTTDAAIPYPDSYWPYEDGGTQVRWQGANVASPLEKYMAVTAPASSALARAWEQRNHGPELPGVERWWGHCPGWVGAAMSHRPLQHEVHARSSGTGGVRACAPGSIGCMRFEIGDVNALMAEVYNDANVTFIGMRCDTAPGAIPRDQYGRILKEGCDGINAGTLVIAASTLLKKRSPAIPFAIEAQNPYNTDEIWNQPAYRYHVYRYERLSEAEAANLVAFGTRTGALGSYLWNSGARGWALVDLGILWVTEYGPNTNVVSGASSTRETRMVAVLELSADPTNPQAAILGGEYIDDPSVGANRLTVAPFLWVVHGPGAEYLPAWVDGRWHNPYVRPSVVRQLIALGQL